MAVGGPGGGELDRGTAALRQLMSRAAEDDAARAEILRLIVQRRVLVATWPHSPESVRTLTNSNGEQAMPLFSGMDVLLDAAHRFGWMSPDGSVSHREIGAAEALRGAVANKVHFVVLDMCTEHAVEFGHEEIERALRAAPKPDDAATRTPRAPALSAAPPAQKRVSRRPHDGSTPIVKMQPMNLSAVIIEESVVPRGRAARPDPRAEPSQAKQLGMVTVARVPQALLQARLAAMQATEPPPAPALPEPQTVERPIAERSATAPDNNAPPPSSLEFAQTEPGLEDSPLPPLDGAPPLEPAARSMAFDLPSLGTVPPLPMPDAIPALPDAHGGLEAAFAAPSDEPQARPAALEAAAIVTQAAKLTKDTGTKQAAREVATMLKDMAAQGSVEEAPASGASKSAANVIVAMLGASVDAAAKKKRRRGTKSSAADTAAAATQEEPTPEAEAAQDRESGVEKRGLCPPAEPLADTLLSQIADALRKYPEVEWACEVSDGTEVPVIGVRVSPTFLTRVPEIKAAVVKAGGADCAALSMLVLEDPQQMREARAQGNLFFPWRKKAGAKR